MATGATATRRPKAGSAEDDADLRGGRGDLSRAMSAPPARAGLAGTVAPSSRLETLTEIAAWVTVQADDNAAAAFGGTANYIAPATGRET